MNTTKQNPGSESSKAGQGVQSGRKDQYDQSAQSSDSKSKQSGTREQSYEKQDSKNPMRNESIKSGVRDMDPSGEGLETPDRPDREDSSKTNTYQTEDNHRSPSSRSLFEAKGQDKDQGKGNTERGKNRGSGADEEWLDIDPEANANDRDFND
jgi:hypothetical protein